MIVTDSVRKCVAFIGQRHGSDYVLRGSVFFLGTIDENRNVVKGYAITARHVLDNIQFKTQAVEVAIRVNLVEGGVHWLHIDLNDWWVHPDPAIDVAILEIARFDVGYDHLFWPTSECADAAYMEANEVGLGEEIFVAGLFRHHHGTRRNIPIIRVGNLACLTEEKVTTSSGDADLLLIEARSIGGLSGSPVFLNLGYSRTTQGRMVQRSHIEIRLLGMIHGHFDVKQTAIDGVAEDANELAAEEKVNTGIAMVVPWRVIESAIALRAADIAQDALK